jgi:hypothetical protein
MQRETLPEITNRQIVEFHIQDNPSLVSAYLNKAAYSLLQQEKIKPDSPVGY